jgi:hypothetical protein
MTTNSVFSHLVFDPAVLALLNDAYATPVPKSETREEKASKPRPIKAPKGEKSEKIVAVKQVIPVPAVQDHVLFLTYLRSAGVREVTDEVTGQIKTIHDPSEERKDQAYCVALYMGWTSEPHGTQLDRAVLHARFSLSPKSGTYTHRSPEMHSARWSVAGFVAGLPNATQKILGDLGARERVAVEEVATMSALYDAAGTDAAGFERRLLRLAKEEPNLAALIRQRPELLVTMLTVAEARLAEVRMDLDALDDFSPAAIERAHACLLARGMPSFEEAIVLLNTTPKA